ncbi:2-dehydropantoate 2-reductase [Apiospora hydei]|uniref:2-dehydropantoate 2-reductase n=1 Tax=Apiospora hydei TaxID=1337664 RepID=A0ABR1X9G3_9PEZI
MAPRILVFGTGSIGAVYTYLLSKAIPASNITAICRSNYEDASKYGFTIQSTIWGNDLNVKPRIARTVEEAVALSNGEPFDYVLVCSKAIPTTQSTAELIRPAVSTSEQHKTAIVLIQNGVGIEEPYAQAFPENPLISTVVYLPATQVRPAVVEHKEVELLHVGTYPADADADAKKAASVLVELLTAADATAKLHDDIQAQRWTKLLVNASWNPICALTRSRDHGFLSSGSNDGEEGEPLEFIRDVMGEIASVAQAYGYGNVNEEMIEFQIGRASVRKAPGIQPSMMADAMAGKSLEVDAIVGNVVRLAKQKGVAVPMLRTIYILARGLDSSLSRQEAA